LSIESIEAVHDTVNQLKNQVQSLYNEISQQQQQLHQLEQQCQQKQHSVNEDARRRSIVVEENGRIFSTHQLKNDFLKVKKKVSQRLTMTEKVFNLKFTHKELMQRRTLLKNQLKFNQEKYRKSLTNTSLERLVNEKTDLLTKIQKFKLSITSNRDKHIQLMQNHEGKICLLSSEIGQLIAENELKKKEYTNVLQQLKIATDQCNLIRQRIAIANKRLMRQPQSANALFETHFNDQSNVG